MNFVTVADRNRSAFPGRFFDDPIFDLKVFNIADQLVEGYDGDYWDYVEIQDTEEPDIGFMRPTAKRTEDGGSTLVNPFSGATVDVDNNLAGMIVTSYAVLQALEKHQTSKLYTLHVNLNNVILDYCSENNRMDVWSIMMD